MPADNLGDAIRRQEDMPPNGTPVIPPSWGQWLALAAALASALELSAPSPTVKAWAGVVSRTLMLALAASAGVRR